MKNYTIYHKKVGVIIIDSRDNGHWICNETDIEKLKKGLWVDKWFITDEVFEATYK